MFDLDYPALLGSCRTRTPTCRAWRPSARSTSTMFEALTDQAFAEYGELTGRRTSGPGLPTGRRGMGARGQGSVVSNAEAVADYLRAERA